MRLQRVLPAALALAVIAGFASAVGSSVASSDSGFLQQFAPRSATTWWAIVASNLHAKTWLVRTTDSGRYWRAVTPPVKLVSSSSFLGRDVGWIEADALHPGAPGAPRTEPVYRTLDGGRSWRRLARVPAECRLDFVDLRHGWCIGIDAAMGSAGVHLYRTGNGGASWSLVSRTGLYGHDSTRGALPYGCDKTIAFTSPRVGWAALYCNAGLPTLYRSSDGGARLHELAAAPVPKGAPSPAAGGGVSLPAVQGLAWPSRSSSTGLHRLRP